MIKKLLFCLLLFLPFLSSAQSEAGLSKDYAKDVHDMTIPLRFDDKLNIIAINTEQNDITVSALDVELNEAWSITLDGYAISVTKFKGKILVVTTTKATPHSFLKDVIYTGYILDPATGKTILQKELYNKHIDYLQSPFFFAPKDGSFFKIAIRQTNVEAKMNWANLFFPIAFYNLGRMITKEKETADITVMDFDEKLNPVNVFHPAVSDDSFISMTCNELGDLFVAWYRKGNINVLKYPQGKAVSTNQVNEEFDMHKRTEGYFTFVASKKNPNVLYVAITYKNLDNDPELTVSRLDLVKNTYKPVTEVFARTHVKELEKAYVPFNKKLDKPFDVIGKYMSVKIMSEENDRLMVFISSDWDTSTSMSGNAGGSTFTTTTVHEGSLIINGYDLDLEPKYTQLFPSGYSVPFAKLMHPGIYKNGNNLDIIADYKKDGTLSGIMDIATGEWSDMLLLPKKKLGGTDFPQADRILWYPTGFILPYTHQRGYTKVNQDISLQQIAY